MIIRQGKELPKTLELFNTGLKFLIVCLLWGQDEKTLESTLPECHILLKML